MSHIEKTVKNLLNSQKLMEKLTFTIYDFLQLPKCISNNNRTTHLQHQPTTKQQLQQGQQQHLKETEEENEYFLELFTGRLFFCLFFVLGFGGQWAVGSRQ